MSKRSSAKLVLEQLTKANDFYIDFSGDFDYEEETFESEIYLFELSDFKKDESDYETNVEASLCASQSSITSFQETPTSIHKGRKRKEYKKTSIVHSHSVVVGDSQICKHCDAAYSNKSTISILTVDIDTSLDEPDKPLYKKQKKNFTKAEEFLLQFIVSAALPFIIVENSYFKKFVECLNPGFVLPSRYTLTNHLVANEFSKIRNRFKLELIKAQAVSVTLDGWSSIQQNSYFGVTCHFFNELTLLCSRTLEISNLPGSHTAENIANALFNVLRDWGIVDKIVSFVTDNAKNMQNIKNYLLENIRTTESKISEIHHIGFLAHLLNLIVKKITKFSSVSIETCEYETEEQNETTGIPILNETENSIMQNFSDLVNNCRKIASVFHQSSIACEVLEEKQKLSNIKPNKIIQDITTRWNSTFLMLKRIFQQKGPINDALRDRKLNNKYEYLILNENEIITLKDSVCILKPFSDATTELSGVNYPTISIVIPILLSLRYKLLETNNESLFSTTFKKYLHYYTDSYLNKHKVLNDSLLITATYLNVRTKYFKIPEAQLYMRVTRR
ncbi:zinc finger BED domain-containing 1-like [Brachionus plicatilis]|uniref:Zinc finger BED domain-containing 1-like n=1 Tax=Brachionus plicatilis TaxID=10195 RepID=A0A3M7RCC4_BRAPC|nr:zinc finger BED domain-containing 1-like [Brachionus plicatilis]